MKRLLLAIVALSALTAPHIDAQQDGNRAAVVVNETEMCVFFDEPSITGIELLRRSNLDIVVDETGQGSAVCRIDGTGCDRGDCFCDYPSFWGYWTRDAKDWEFSKIGAADREVTDGSVDGWSYDKDGKPAPPDRTFDDVCDRSVQAAPTIGTLRESVERTNYVPFIALTAALVLLSVVVVRRRRTRR